MNTPCWPAPQKHLTYKNTAFQMLFFSNRFILFDIIAYSDDLSCGLYSSIQCTGHFNYFIRYKQCYTFFLKMHQNRLCNTVPLLNLCHRLFQMCIFQDMLNTLPFHLTFMSFIQSWKNQNYYQMVM